uniref:Bm413 n=1 Tax=Brugia malayi TaxID=6279 RepID=A0A1I9G1K1_BRUMA|nr:Bm413 [Brugia malayi]
MNSPHISLPNISYDAAIALLKKHTITERKLARLFWL